MPFSTHSGGKLSIYTWVHMLMHSGHPADLCNAVYKSSCINRVNIALCKFVCQCILMTFVLHGSSNCWDILEGRPPNFPCYLLHSYFRHSPFVTSKTDTLQLVHRPEIKWHLAVHACVAEAQLCLRTVIQKTGCTSPGHLFMTKQ